VELYLYSPSGSVSDREQSECSHHFVRFPTSRHRDLHFVTSSQVVLTRCTQEGGRPVTSCHAQSELSVKRPNYTQSCIRPRNCRTSKVSVFLLGGANIPSSYFTDRFSRFTYKVTPSATIRASVLR
jgi:hypothetical protein